MGVGVFERVFLEVFDKKEEGVDFDDKVLPWGWFLSLKSEGAKNKNKKVGLDPKKVRWGSWKNHHDLKNPHRYIDKR